MKNKTAPSAYILDEVGHWQEPEVERQYWYNFWVKKQKEYIITNESNI